MGKLLLPVGVLLALCGVHAGASNYPQEGPFYDMPYLAGSAAVQVRRMWMAAGSDQVVRKHNFMFSVELHTAAENRQDGEIVFRRQRRVLNDDRAGMWSRIIPVRGSDLVVQFQTDYKRSSVVSVLDKAGGRRELASFPQSGQTPEDGACALTRSGRHALLVRPDRITVWDVVTFREERIEGEQKLLAIRAALMKGTGNPGNWWLTDDLQYIVVDTTHREWDADGGEGPVYSTPFQTAGLTLDVAKDAVVFDRKAGTFSVFESHIPSTVLGTFKIADVESVAGRIWLLYV
jgi:hypothetical protein